MKRLQTLVTFCCFSLFGIGQDSEFTSQNSPNAKRLSSFWIEQIPLFSARFGLVDPHRLLTWVWSTPKQAIPLILIGIHGCVRLESPPDQLCLKHADVVV